MFRGNAKAEADQRAASKSFEQLANPPPAEDLTEFGNHDGIGREPRDGHESEDTAAKEQS